MSFCPPAQSVGHKSLSVLDAPFIATSAVSPNPCNHNLGSGCIDHAWPPGGTSEGPYARRLGALVGAPLERRNVTFSEGPSNSSTCGKYRAGTLRLAVSWQQHSVARSYSPADSNDRFSSASSTPGACGNGCARAHTRSLYTEMCLLAAEGLVKASTHTAATSALDTEYGPVPVPIGHSRVASISVAMG